MCVSLPCGALDHEYVNGAAARMKPHEMPKVSSNERIPEKQAARLSYAVRHTRFLEPIDCHAARVLFAALPRNRPLEWL